METGCHSSFARILVARGGAIGDFVLTLPVFQALRTRYPKAFIEILGYPDIASIATIDGHADRISRIESLAFTPLFAPSLEIPQPTRDYFASFDLIISYIHDPDCHFQRRVGELTPAKFLAGPGRPNQTATSHATQLLLRPLEEIGLFITDNEPRLLRAKTDASAIMNSPLPEQGSHGAAKRSIACHPGSGSPSKNWPLDKWIELITWLIEESLARPIIVGGAADQGQLEKLKNSLPPSECEIWENLPLPQLAMGLKQCSAFVGHDSGISHLAAAVGIPTAALWGPTNPDVWRPLGPRVKLISSDEGLAHLPVELVSAEVGHLLH